MADATKITAGVFVALTLLISGLYATADLNKTYSCQANGLVGYCDKLTTNNTRCYYTLDNKTTYKGCSTGWAKVNIPEQINNITETNSPCYVKGDYKYCCESKQMNTGACDFIVRRNK